MNYKKGLLSLATILALSGIASADTNTRYLPLTTTAEDGSWVLFGVNGFSTGVASAIGTTATDFSANFTEIEEVDTQDTLSTAGLLFGTDALGWVQTVDDADMVTLKVGVNITGVLYESLEPVRTMYIKVAKTAPNVKFDYKASLEGKTLEILANSVLYSVTISQDSTYSDAVTAVESQTVASTDPVLTAITDVVDYDLKDNPVDAKYYSKAANLQADANLSTGAAETSQFYHFDSVSQQWKIWNTNYSGAANDFTEFAKGDSYWGRIDVNDPVTALANDGAAAAVNGAGGTNINGSGLILGASGNSAPTADTYKYDDNTTKLAPGWNMLAFDDTQEYVRNAATGLIVTLTGTGGVIVITDSTGVYSVTATLAAATTAAEATAINLAMETAKLKGDIPTSFNVKAFYSGVGAAGEIVLISDAKFTIEDDNVADTVSAVTTLTGAIPYNELGYNTTAITLLATATAGQSTATSVYGEYALMVDLLVNDLVDGAGVVAADLDSVAAGAGGAGGTTHSAMISLGTSSADYSAIALTAANDGQPTAALAQTEIEAHPLFAAATAPTTAYGLMTPIDSDDSGANDKVILASTVPFYIKDNTYTRVFTYDNTAIDGAKTFEVVGGSNDFSVIAVAGTAATATLANDEADTGDTDTGVYAGTDAAAAKIVAVSTSSSTFDVKDLESGTEGFLLNTTSTEDIAKGAVKGVYSLDHVAKLPLIQHQYTYDSWALHDTATDGVTVDFSAIGTAGAGAASVNVQIGAGLDDSTAEILAYLDAIVAEVNSQLALEDVHGWAYHDYTESVGLDYSTSTLTIVGMEVNIEGLTAITVGTGDFTANGDIATTAGTLGAGLTDGGNLVADLKSNAVYTPDFASFGPLYTMRDAGYDVRAILKATTDMTAQDTTWDSIDLTRDESDWFKNNEFNLFSANIDTGYWVYLEANSAASGIAMTNASFTPTYTYYFDNEDADGLFPTSNMINGGQFSVTITGLDDETANAYATVGGEKVQLKNTLYTNDYTATFSKYSLLSFSESGQPVSISVRATNGKGAAETMAVDYSFDYGAPVLSAVTSPTLTTVKFTADDNSTAKFYLFKDYIQEVDSARDGTSTTLVSSYAAAAGVTSQNICESLTYGDVDTLRVVALDGTGVFGTANVSDAEEFTYATTLKGAHILTHLGGGADDKTIIGTTYDSTCTLTATQPAVATDNTGVSLKALVSGQTAIISYEEIDGVASTLSGAWVSTYSVDGTNAIQIQNLSEYAGEPFFLEYGGKMYKTAFPANEAAALATVATPIPLAAAQEVAPINATLQ